MSIWWISQSMATLIMRMHLMVINLTTGAKISLNSTWEYLIVNDRIFELTISPDASLLVRNIYLHSTFLWSFGRLVNLHVALTMSESYSSCIVTFHLLTSSDLNVSHKLKELSKNATLAYYLPCWGRIWFFHHCPSGRRPLNMAIVFRGYFFIVSSFATKWSPTLFFVLLTLIT